MEKLNRFETDSLILRRFARTDAAALFELTRQPEITDVLPEWKMTERQLDDFLEFVISSYGAFNPDDVRIMLAIEHKEDRLLIGWCGVFPNDLLDPADREIAYALSKDYRNLGYATEAVRGMLSTIFKQTSLKQIVAIVKPFNQSSIRVIEKAGFEYRQNAELSDGAEYRYYVAKLGVRSIGIREIEPYLDLMAEVEHVLLDRRNQNHDRWIRRRVQSYFDRGARLFAYHDPNDENRFGIITVLHEEAPEGIGALGARAEILNIGVNPTARRQGVGSELLKIAEEFAARRGAYCLLLMTYAEDYDVIAFYGKNGFIPTASLPDVYGPDLEGNLFLRKIIR